MSRYRLGNSNTIVTLASKSFAGGGEGNLYKVQSPSNLRKYVAKLYHPHKLDADRIRKIEYLVAHPPLLSEGNADAHPSVVWAKELLYKNDQLVGFLMPYVEGEKLEILCTPKIPRKLRKQWERFRFQNNGALALRSRLCFNICSAIHQVHAAQRYVLVDMKPDNIVIQPNGLVSIVDTDSVEVVENGESIFDAPVATPEYTPPEHYRTLSYDPTETEEWDRFGLGVILYKLLFGIHPFAASAKPPYDHLVSLHDKIKAGLFVHHPKYQASFSTIPPPHKNFYKLDEGLRELFFRCFVDGHDNPSARPSAEEWCAAFLMAIDDEAAYKRYGHILGGGRLTKAPHFSLPSMRISVPTVSSAAKQLLELSENDSLPTPAVRNPTESELQNFGVAPMAKSRLIPTVLVVIIACAIVPPIGGIMLLYLWGKAQGKYKESWDFKQRQSLEQAVRQLKRRHKVKTKQAQRAKARFKRSVRKVAPKATAILSEIEQKIQALKDFIAKQDQKVRSLEERARGIYNSLQRQYTGKAQSDRLVARFVDTEYDNLSKLRIAIDSQHKKAVTDLTKDNPVNERHPDFKEGKLAIDKFIREERIKVSSLVGEQKKRLKASQETALEDLFAEVKAEADLLENLDRLWRNTSKPSPRSLDKIINAFLKMNLTSVAQIRMVNVKEGAIVLKSGKRFSSGLFRQRKQMMQNLEYWSDEIKHKNNSLNKAKAKLNADYKTKIQALHQEERLELKALELRKKEELKKVKVEVQKVLLGAPFQQLQQDYETVTTLVEELADRYEQQEEELLMPIRDEYEQIIGETEYYAEDIKAAIVEKEAQLKQYEQTLGSKKARERYQTLRMTLDELKTITAKLEQKEFSYKTFKKVNFKNYILKRLG